MILLYPFVIRVAFKNLQSLKYFYNALYSINLASLKIKILLLHISFSSFVKHQFCFSLIYDTLYFDHQAIILTLSLKHLLRELTLTSGFCFI